MQDKIYESAKYLALGILIGYLAPYALTLIKTYRAKPQNSLETN